MSDVYLGLAAGTLTTGAWLPQLYRTWRRRSAADLSWGYLIAFGTGVALWTSYGIVRSDAALIVTNVITVALVAGLIVLKSELAHKVLRRRSPSKAAATPPE